MKFKEKDIVYVVWSCENIEKHKISRLFKDFYELADGEDANEEDVFKRLSEAKTYARDLLDKYILKTNKYINNVRPKLGK